MPVKITYPTIPVGHPDYKWTSGADVQATWRRFGWKPTFGSAEVPAAPKTDVVDKTKKYWRVK